MPRVVEVTVPEDMTDRLVEDLTGDDDVLSVRVLRGASVQPVGDVVAFDVMDDGFSRAMRRLDSLGSGRTRRCP